MELQSFSLLVGTSACNAKCYKCAGRELRKYAPASDGIIDEVMIKKTLHDCYLRGARRISLSSSGEPTLSPLSVTKTLELIDSCKTQDVRFFPISLYTNGIRIGEDKDFCHTYLSYWKKLGLTTLYLTVHSADEQKNARRYGIETYPSLNDVISRIHDAHILVRANLVLSKKTIRSYDEFVYTVQELISKKVDSFSVWKMQGLEKDSEKKHVVPDEDIEKMSMWLERTVLPVPMKFLGRVYHAPLLSEKKVTLFQDGTLAPTWCTR